MVTLMVVVGLNLFILAGGIISYIAAKQGMKKDKKILENVLLALCFNGLFGIMSAVWWFDYAGPINEFLLFGGLLLIAGATFVCLIILTLTLLVKKMTFIAGKDNLI
ncbi:hypothetical protein Q7A53_03455 [Halobacillus rhizosphaerae]|uniref:hypothetical protein n=1 Tax=Halobacillus rhizosphaerae TaxID=3064889 RepID=UPI00398A70AF